MKSLARIRRALKSVAVHQPAPRASVKPPRVNAAPWRLTRRLPSGRSLAVFRASTLNDRGPGCYVLKMPMRTRPRDHLASALLQREANVAADVNHRGVVSVVAANRSDRPYLVLPYLEGITLRRLLGSPVHLPIGLVLSIVRQAAAALAAMHSAGWLHGQVQPGHLIVSPQGHATLIDLTQARRFESSECETNNELWTSPIYAAPETFFASSRITAATDIYALGVVLFEALAGEPPFVAASHKRLEMCHRREAPPDLRRFRASASLEVAELVRRMLTKEPLRRPSAEQLVRWLAELEIEELAL